jgi:hypothetical protein
MELGSASESESVSAVRKEKQAQPQTSTTHHSAGLYLSIVQPEPASNKLTLAQTSYRKDQTKKVLNHAREELMKEVRKAGYNVLIVEG